MSTRLNELDIGFNLNEMYLGTFHSICLRMLEDYREFTRLRRSFTLMDQFDQQFFLYKCCCPLILLAVSRDDTNAKSP